ncbi:U4/U6 snRNP-specific spliceosomal protein [Clavulina sp. PMI_390]|nr:U4/U6 snRNP-specific spliceosomal protein [Clavulina sp. PMI_390]
MESLSLDTLVDDSNYALGGESSQRAREENQAILAELERRKRTRTLAVPTDDGRVRARLREIGEPVTLFGERAPDRRERLKYVMSQIQLARGGDLAIPDVSEEGSSDEEEEEFYTPGTPALLEARQRIAEFSLPRARRRIQRQKVEAHTPLARLIDLRRLVVSDLKRFGQLGSQIADERPISHVRFSPDGQKAATGSWSGGVRLWNIPSCTKERQYHGHSDRVGGVAWHPKATLTQSPSVVNLASGGADKAILLWTLASEIPIARLEGHQDRVVRVAFHPSGQYLGSASFDGTWRLWDCASETELLVQEGHSKEVFAVEFQDDGALAASGGLDGIGRVWDLRTGRTAMVLDGHAQAIFGIDFSPNGYQIATGSGDDTIRIWDMRSLKSAYVIPAHTSTVSDVRFFRHRLSDDLAPVATLSTNDQIPNEGLYLASSGYDGLVKLWAADDWQLARTLSTDAGRVMSVDISPDGMYMLSGSSNRSIQLYGRE